MSKSAGRNGLNSKDPSSVTTEKAKPFTDKKTRPILAIELAFFVIMSIVKTGRDHKGRALRYIFCFLKKKAKGCRCDPSRG